MKTKNQIPSSYDVIGDIAILKFENKIKREKKRIAEKLLKQRNNIKTVLEKKEKVKGRLRKIKLGFLGGEKKIETVHTESGCRFKIDVEKCYFSPRLSNDRLEVSEKISKIKNINKKNILVMFAGVGPYPIVISKKAKPKKVTSIEIGKDCVKLMRKNIKLNKLKNMEIIQGDVKKKVPLLVNKKEKFDIIVMPPLNLKYSFLKEAFKVSKKETRIFYYDFGKDINNIIKKVKEEAKKYRKKIRILDKNTAGNIAPYKFRYRVEFVIK